MNRLSGGYLNLGSVSTLTKQKIKNKRLQFIFCFQIFLILQFSMIYLIYCHMSSEIIQSVVYDNNNYDAFLNMSTSYFHKISFHYCEDYLMMKLTLG
jgi:hypothetical protein